MTKLKIKKDDEEITLVDEKDIENSLNEKVNNSDLDDYIQKSSTAGLVKNDGSIDTQTKVNVAQGSGNANKTLSTDSSGNVITEAKNNHNHNLNNLNIYADGQGGTNLIEDTQIFNTPLTNVGLRDGTYKNCTYRRVDNTSGTQFLDIGFKIPAGTFKHGEKYTLSFWAKGTGNIVVFNVGGTNYIKTKPINCTSGGTNTQNFSQYADGNVQFALTSEWKRYFVTWELNPTSNSTNDISVNKILLLRTIAGADAYWAGVMYERGEIPHDWSPSPKDIYREKITASSTSIANLNHYKKAGFYYNNNNDEAKYIIHCPNSDGTNTPYINNKSFFLLVEDWGDSDYSVKQTLTYYNTGNTYIRTKNNEKWSDWKKLSVDGHTHNLSNIDAIIINANANFNNYRTQGFYKIDYTNAQSSTNMPAKWGGLLTVKDIYNGVSQTFQRYGQNTTSIWYRTYYNTDGSWSSWKTIVNDEIPDDAITTAQLANRSVTFDKMQPIVFWGNGSGATAGYIKMIKFKFTDDAQRRDKPITFDLYNRQRTDNIHVSLKFKSVENNDPDVDYFSYTSYNAVNLYLYKEETSTWSLIIQKEADANMEIANLTIPNFNRDYIAYFNMNTQISVLPSNTTENPLIQATQRTYGGISNNNIYAPGFIKNNGTSSQFLKANGSVFDISTNNQGGTNLLQGTQNFNGAKGILQRYPMGTYRNLEYVLVDNSSQTSFTDIAFLIPANTFDYGEKYTLSFWVNGSGEIKIYNIGDANYVKTKVINCTSGGTSLNDYNDGRCIFTLDNTGWKRYFVTWELNPTANSSNDLNVDKKIILRTMPGATAHFAGAMYERGEIPHDWSPSPLDNSEFDFSKIKGTDNTVGYIKALKLQIGSTYQDKPIKIEIYQRNRKTTNKINIAFQSINSTDPSVNNGFFNYYGDENFKVYLYKESAGVWSLITSKGHDDKYGEMMVKVSNPNPGIFISKLDTHIASLPSSTTNNPLFTACCLDKTTTATVTYTDGSTGTINFVTR